MTCLLKFLGEWPDFAWQSLVWGDIGWWGTRFPPGSIFEFPGRKKKRPSLKPWKGDACQGRPHGAQWINCLPQCKKMSSVNVMLAEQDQNPCYTEFTAWNSRSCFSAATKKWSGLGMPNERPAVNLLIPPHWFLNLICPLKLQWCI